MARSRFGTSIAATFLPGLLMLSAGSVLLVLSTPANVRAVNGDEGRPATAALLLWCSRGATAYFGFLFRH